MRKFPRAILFICLFPFWANAQQASFEFFSTKDGLKGNNTSTVTQDEQGFLWFVNSGIIHRYDGRNFITFLPPSDLPSKMESLIGLSTYQDSLLFAWGQNYLYLINPRTNHWEMITVMKDDLKTSFDFFQKIGTIETLIISSLKDIHGHFQTWQLQHKQLINVTPFGIQYLEKGHFWFDLDKQGNAYLAYNDSFYYSAGIEKTIHKISLRSICSDCINFCFQFTADGGLVLLANWQFYIWDKAGNRFIPHPANRFLQKEKPSLHRFILDKAGNIWACGHARNLVHYDALQDSLYNYHEELKKLIPYHVDLKGLFIDNSGIVWIDTRLGLLKVKKQSFPFRHILQEKDPQGGFYSFRGLDEDVHGNLYAIYYSGLAIFHPQKHGFLQTIPLSNTMSIFDVTAEENRLWLNNREWFNISSGKLEQKEVGNQSYPLGDNGFFAKDIQNTLWWLAHFQLFYLDNPDSSTTWKLALELPGKEINKTDVLHASRFRRELWFSYQGKLARYMPESPNPTWFNPSDWGVSISRIMAIEEDEKGHLWLGTDNGLYKLDPDKGIIQGYTINDGLPNKFICGMLAESDSVLWLSTNNGLSRFHISDETFLNFYERDGLTFNEFNRRSYFKSRDGHMYFGGLRGINAFYPSKIMKTYHKQIKNAQVILSALEYIDERQDSLIRKPQINHEEEIHFYHWHWSYSFEYTFTDYSNPEEVFFSYMMEGYKDSWSRPSKFNFARFNSLPPGTYFFRVKARDSQGEWHPNELSLKVVVHPPWWASWWAYTLYIISLSIMVFGILRFYRRRLILKNQLALEHEEAKRLKELDHFKSRLFTNLTHEFRTPLTVILGMIRQIRESPKQYLDQGTEVIERNGRNLLQLINQLLDLSRLENNAFQLQLQQGDIISFLRYLTESFQTFANGQNLSLRFFTTEKEVIMDYDPEQVKQILTNLLSNAIKFTPSGGEVSLHVQVANKALEIEVRDTGIGIAGENLHHVFDRFFQVDSVMTRQGEGTGIGLAHSKELVCLMGGEISVTSEIGKGSCFWIKLPIRRKAPVKEPGSMPQMVPIPIPPASLQPAFIAEQNPASSSLPQLLIIEDNPDVVTYLKSCLEQAYQLDIGYNGKIGIEKALEHIPDLIISDVMMPEKDGFEVCDTLKNDMRTSHIPIILLTAKADAASKLAGLKRGADVYLAKPFDKEELLVRIDMMLAQQERIKQFFLQGKTADNPEIEAELQPENAFLQQINEIIAENYHEESFGLPDLCRRIAMSRSQLFRKMKALIDTSPSEYIRKYRLARARDLLLAGEHNVSEVCYATGFKNLAHFSKSFQEEFGNSPSEFRR